jgi:hypothetical protein
MAALSAYEQQRLDNIAENMRVLSTLGLSETLAPPQAKKPKYCSKCKEVWSPAHRWTCSMRDDTRVDRVLRQRPKRVARSYAEDAGDEEGSGSGGDSAGDDEYNSNEEEEEEEEEEEDGDGSPSSSGRSSQRGGRPRGGGEDGGGSRSAGSSGRSSRQGAPRSDDPLPAYSEDMRLAAAEAKQKAASEGLALPRSKRNRCGYLGVTTRWVPDPSGSGPLGHGQSSGLPAGWVCSTQVAYKRYEGPNGERAPSIRKAWQTSRGELGPYEAIYANVSLGSFHTAEEARAPPLGTWSTTRPPPRPDALARLEPHSHSHRDLAPHPAPHPSPGGAGLRAGESMGDGGGRPGCGLGARGGGRGRRGRG